jgi:hypothetical protein
MLSMARGDRGPYQGDTMRLFPASIPVRIGAVAAAAVIAVAGGTTVASAAVAAPAVGKVLTALSIGVVNPAVSNHEVSAVVAGRLFEPREFGHGVRGKVVWLLRRGPSGAWVVAGHELTGLRGGVAFAVHVWDTATFRLVFRGTPNFTAAVSAPRTIP